jgi:hypothetical protein
MALSSCALMRSCSRTGWPCAMFASSACAMARCDVVGGVSV